MVPCSSRWFLNQLPERHLCLRLWATGNLCHDKHHRPPYDYCSVASVGPIDPPAQKRGRYLQGTAPHPRRRTLDPAAPTSDLICLPNKHDMCGPRHPHVGRFGIFGGIKQNLKHRGPTPRTTPSRTSHIRVSPTADTILPALLPPYCHLLSSPMTVIHGHAHPAPSPHAWPWPSPSWSPERTPGHLTSPRPCDV